VAQAWSRGIGISRFISVGNQAQLTTADYLNFLATDPATTCVGVLLEGVTDGAPLVAALERLRDAGKHVVALKVGRGAMAAAAVKSHTGSLAGDYAVYKAVLEETGAIAVDSITELLDAAHLLSTSGRPRGRRVGVLSTSGGACALIADLCERHGFDLPALPPDVQSELIEILPGFASTANPIDVTGQVATDPSIYGRALNAVLRRDAVDVVLVMLTTIADPQAAEIAAEVVAQMRRHEQPVLVSWTIAPELARDGLALLAADGVPVFGDPARAIEALAAISRRRNEVTA
jgi:acyl-CoA synthetase (NDP forming)